MKRLISRSMVAIALLFPISSANASLMLVGGASGTIPTTAEINDLLSSPLFGNVGSIPAVFGAQISHDGIKDLRFDFLGFEASWSTTFVSGETFDTEDYVSNTVIATSPDSPLDSFVTEGVNGLIAFQFVVDTLGNPPGPGPISYAMSAVGQSMVIWLDHGWGDYDDMVIRISEVPLPATLPLYGTGLGLMALFGWWRKRRAAAA